MANDDSSAIISQYLDYSERVKIVSRLVEEDKLSQVLDVLNIISINFSDLNDLIKTLFEKVKSKLIKQRESLDSKSFTGYGDSAYNEFIANENLRMLAQLVSKIEPLWNLFERWIVEELESYVVKDRKQLFEGTLYEELIGARIQDGADEHDLNEVDAIFLLKFLETVYLSGSNVPKLERMDEIILLLLSCNVEILAFTASCLLRWRVSSIAQRALEDRHFDGVSWDLVEYCFNDVVNRDWKLRSALVFTLRFLLVSEPSSKMVELFQNGGYWRNLQIAMAHEVQEYRKLGICVLRLTIEKLSTLQISFKTDTFTWDSTYKEEYLGIWDNFTTLYEIVALETALNQIEAASSQILNLFESHVLHSTWGLILLSTGLKATMHSVRKYMVSMLFMIDDKSIFAGNVDVLKKLFLPAALEAQFFTVKDSSCPYGEKFANWIASIILQSNEKASVVISAALEFLVEEPTLFDPSRVYLTFGILKSLKGKSSRLISSYHLGLVRRLFEVESEEPIVETALQTMNLKFLLHIDNSTGPDLWIQAISFHIKNHKNGYKFFMPLLEDFIDFAIAYLNIEHVEQSFFNWAQVDETFGLLSLLIFEYQDVPMNDSMILEMSRSGAFKDQFNSKASQLFSELLSGEKSMESYENSEIIVNYAGFNSYTWKSIKLGGLYQSLLKEFSEGKFKFLASIYQKMFDNDAEFLELTWSNFEELYELTKDYLSGTRDFKFKDEVYGTYMKFLFFHLKAFPLNWEGYGKEDDEVTRLLRVLRTNVTEDNDNYMGNLYVSKLCAYILESYVTVGKGVGNESNWDLLFSVVDILSKVWEETFDERLILNQKNLHDALIKGVFHPTVLYYATEDNEKGRELAELLSKRGQDIIDQAHTRRGYLSLLAQNINSFIRLNSSKLDDKRIDHWWLINLIIGILTSTHFNSNIFFLRPIIADLYDKNINFYQTGGESLYKRVYGPEEVSAKILIIDSFLYCPPVFKEQALIGAAKFTGLLLPKKQTDGIEEIKRVQTWQLLILGLKTFDKTMFFNFVKDSVLPSITDDISPLVRTYKEWFVAYIIADHYEESKANVVEDSVFYFINDQTKPAVTVSHERIAFLALVGLTNVKRNCPQRLLNRFMGAIVPNATTNKPLIRHFSNSLMLSLWPSFSEHITNVTLNQIVHQLYLGAQELRIPGQYRVGDANTWNIYYDLTLTEIFGGVLKRTSSAEVPYFSEGLFKKYLTNKGWPIGHDDTSSWLTRRIEQENSSFKEPTSDPPSQLQMKSGAWKTLMDIDNSKPEKTVSRSDLVVVASLVDKTPNLGGICRLCDVLGVGLLTIPSIKMKNNPQFKNVAVTADRWMPIEEVTPQDIASFMRLKKQEGYTLIGLEQTDKSVELDGHYRFPQKSLIVLGTEAHGIPGPLLSELDLCLEIRQFGVVRSMNIQTATAVIVHSYTVQHM